MFKENENSSTKTEDANGQHVNQITKMNPFGHLTLTSAKLQNNGDNNGDNSENSRARENSEENLTPEEIILCDNINEIQNDFVIDTKKRALKMGRKIGKEIFKCYHGKYGDKEIKKIAGRSHISESTLYKFLKLAKKFSEAEFQRLLTIKYISSRLVVKFFPMENEQIFQILESSSNAKEAQHKIYEIKQQESAKGASLGAGTDSNVPDSYKATGYWRISRYIP